MEAYGNLMNRVAESSLMPTPEIGMGATETMYSDRHAGTIVSVYANGKSLTWQRDLATRTDSNGMSESQEYAYERNPDASPVIFKMTKRRGWRDSTGTGLIIGERDEYHDYSF